MKADAEGANKEEGAKGRKRKKSAKADVQETSDVCGEAGPTTGEIDPITATIEAVLANASAIDTSVEKSKKVKRVKKLHQEGNVAKTPKQDGEKSTADDDENDDSSTAGNVEEFYEWGSHHVMAFCCDNITM